MNTPISLGRRSFVRSLPLAAAAAAVPTAALAAATEHPTERIDRLMGELSDALGQFSNGSFRAIVEPASKPRAQVLLQAMKLGRRNDALLHCLGSEPDRGLADYHAGQTARAMQREHGGLWQATVNHDHAWCLIAGDLKAPPGVWQNFA